MNQLTAAENLAVGATLGVFIGMISLFGVIFYVLLVIAGWKIFKKAGEPGWKSIIPIYNIYILYKIVGMKEWFWGILAVSLISSIVTGLNTDASGKVTGNEILVTIVILVSVCISLAGEIIYSIRTSKAFGHGGGYALGLFFLPNIFWLILGFGGSKYNKKFLKNN